MGSNKTAFEKIAYFNTLIGNDNAASVEGLAAQLYCIREEFDELTAALNDYAAACHRCEVGGNDGGDVADATAAFDQIRDGIADVLVTTFGLAHRAGIHADQDLQRVYESNMSKFLSNDHDAYAEAHKIYMHNDLSICVNETAPSVWALTSAADQHGKDGKFYPKGKLLKPSTFKEPDFSAKDHGFSGGFHDAVLAEINSPTTVEKCIFDERAQAIIGESSNEKFQGFGLGIDPSRFQIQSPIAREEFEQLIARVDTLTATVKTLQSVANGPLE